METTHINHTTYPASLTTKSIESLRYIMADAHAAMQANPDGHKAGYYADEINYCGMEIVKRQRAQ